MLIPRRGTPQKQRPGSAFAERNTGLSAAGHHRAQAGPHCVTMRGSPAARSTCASRTVGAHAGGLCQRHAGGRRRGCRRHQHGNNTCCWKTGLGVSPVTGFKSGARRCGQQRHPRRGPSGDGPWSQGMHQPTASAAAGTLGSWGGLTPTGFLPVPVRPKPRSARVQESYASPEIFCWRRARGACCCRLQGCRAAWPA